MNPPTTVMPMQVGQDIHISCGGLFTPSPPMGEREAPNAKHWEGEGEQTAKFPFSDQAHSAGSPSPYLSPDGGEGICYDVCIR
jgi:hypothetical protein